MALKNKENRTLVLPIDESIYDSFLKDNEIAHELIKVFYEKMPELFPKEMNLGYMLNGRTRCSKKLGIRMRKIKVSKVTYRIRPSFILPYCRAKTEDVSKAFFLLRFGVPFWALAFVFGHNAMWWYRLYTCLSNFSVVGTTVYSPDQLPRDILADEHHIRIQGTKAYVATTIGSNCFLGMEASWLPNCRDLTQAYSVFKEEVIALCPDYQVDSVNVDGWWATHNAWRALFPTITIVECFLHAYLKIRDRATKPLASFFDTAGDKIWDCYGALSKRELAQKIRRLKEWTQTKVPDSPMKNNILKLCQKKKKWMLHLDHPNAYKTSNMLDRLMKAMKRHAFNSQMFHSTISSTSKNFRAFALLYNFTPSCPAVTDRSKGLDSPAARLNGFIYHQDWLQNLLITGHIAHFRSHRNPL